MIRIILFLFLSIFASFGSYAQSYYFEKSYVADDTGTNCFFPSSVYSDGKMDTVFFFQEADVKSGTISIKAKISPDGISWRKIDVAGPFLYQGAMPCIYSAACRKNRICIAILSDVRKITVLETDNLFKDVKVSELSTNDAEFVAPRIFVNSKGGFSLFVSKSKDEAYEIYYSNSRDGISWNPFESFSKGSQLENAFNPIVPYLVPTKTGDALLFQAQYTSSKLISIQLYSSFTKDIDKKNEWTDPVLVTGEKSVSQGDCFFNYNNQGASVISLSSGKNYIAWERSPFSSSCSDIYFAELSDTGDILSFPEKISDTGYCSKASLFEFKGDLNLVWFTNITGNRCVYLAEKNGSWWNDALCLSQNGANPCVMFTNGNKEIAFAWEELVAGKNAISLLITDHTCPVPVLNPKNFKHGERANRKNIQCSFKMSEDSSGIKGYSWIWTQNKKANPPRKIMNTPDEKLIDYTVEKDGIWYLRVSQSDFAGNWSECAETEYYFDSIPPEKPLIASPLLDEAGLVISNSFDIAWDSKDDDVAGYTYTLKYIDSIPHEIAENPRHPSKLEMNEKLRITDSLFLRNEEMLEKPQRLPDYVVTKKNKISYMNIRNGLYLFSIAAIDKVGNIGKTSTLEFALNKYVPVTYVSSVKTDTNSFGDTSISIVGGGFTYDGVVTAVYLDRDGLAPYDYTLRLSSKDYRITSDNRIADMKLNGIKPDEYKVGLLHTDRGLYFTKNAPVTIVETGTVKLKNKYDFIPTWNFVSERYLKHLNVSTAVFVLLMAFAVIVFMSSARALAKTFHEFRNVRTEVKALLEGDIMPEEKKRKAASYKQKGRGLKSKLVLHSTIMIAIMDVCIFVAFGKYMISTQRKTMAESLRDRVSVMMSSIATGTSIYLPQTTPEDNLSLQDIATQVKALPEGIYATIVGSSEEQARIGLDTVWATTDRDILDVIDSETYAPGVSKITDQSLLEVLKINEKINSQADEEAGLIAMNISELTQEALSLVSKNDEKSISRRQEIQIIRNQLSSKLDVILDAISDKSEGSVPEFDVNNIEGENTEYVFYKPVLYRQGNDSNYVHGIVFIKVSTKSLLEKIHLERKLVIYTCCIILGIALLIAFISTFVLATYIVRPIKKLASHVAMIRDTVDKETLDGKDIVIKTKDEIGLLSDTVNEMTHGLVEAAVQNKNLTLGKDIQTKFIPLEVRDGITMTTGSLSENGADFFSYYAGADDLSGDYFDYKKLDDKHYAVIKCDVSGHGVPAALIMVEVATLFLNYFRNWSMKSKLQGTNISPVVGQINDLLESRGFKGRFAAFTLCIVNTETGDCWFCNAGDNLVHVYDSVQRKKKVLTLQETPAAGIFSTDLVDMKGGYQVSKFRLKKDDVLFLYTDGIEEAKRCFRDENMQIIKCVEPGLKESDPHENHAVGDDNEEMTPERVSEIIESVYDRSEFVLHKHHALEGQEDFSFDFSTCDDTAEDAIMALVSVEKVFRMYKTKNPQMSDRVKVDRKIDDFLHRHFNKYAEYCSDKQEIESDPTHVYYCGVREDPQYDDLTLVAIKKK